MAGVLGPGPNTQEKMGPYGSYWVKKKKKKYGPGWQNPAATEWVDRVDRGQGQQRRGGPDYAGLINNMLNQQRSDVRAESVADAAGRDAAIRRLLVSWGEIPDLGSLGISGEASGVLGGLMDERTRELANKNTAEGTSAKARLEAANATAQRQIPAQFAGRGLLRTGQTGHALGEQALTHKQTLFDSLNEMLGGVESAVGSYAANERQRQRQIADAEREAAWQQAQMWEDMDPGGGGGGEDYGTPPYQPDPQAGTPYGGIDDDYWKNLIDYYEGSVRQGGKKKQRKRQAMGPYGPYGPAR